MRGLEAIINKKKVLGAEVLEYQKQVKLALEAPMKAKQKVLEDAVNQLGQFNGGRFGFRPARIPDSVKSSLKTSFGLDREASERVTQLLSVSPREMKSSDLEFLREVLHREAGPKNARLPAAMKDPNKKYILERLIEYRRYYENSF